MLEKKECSFVVFGALSSDPSMSFVVLKSAWINFAEKDKDELKETLKSEINEAKSNPDKFNNMTPSAPMYKRANSNISNIRSYSVILSGGKSASGALMLDNEIIRNW